MSQIKELLKKIKKWILEEGGVVCPHKYGICKHDNEDCPVFCIDQALAILTEQPRENKCKIHKNAGCAGCVLEALKLQEEITEQLEAQLKAKDELLFAFESVRAPKQPLAGDFTKEMRLLYELRPKVIEGKIVAKHIFDLCTRLDHSEASRKKLLTACKKVQQWLDTSSLQQVLVHYTEDERRHALIMGLATNLERLEAAITKVYKD